MVWQDPQFGLTPCAGPTVRVSLTVGVHRFRVFHPRPMTLDLFKVLFAPRLGAKARTYCTVKPDPGFCSRKFPGSLRSKTDHPR